MKSNEQNFFLNIFAMKGKFTNLYGAICEASSAVCIVIEKICVAKFFWNEEQQRWLKSVTCAIQFVFAVKCADKLTFHTRER